jgi:hypothetical protein
MWFIKKQLVKVVRHAGRQWPTTIILATQEEEIRRITIQSHSGQIVFETLSQKTLHKKGLVQWLKVQALSSNPSTPKETKTQDSLPREQMARGMGSQPLSPALFLPTLSRQPRQGRHLQWPHSWG